MQRSNSEWFEDGSFSDPREEAGEDAPKSHQIISEKDNQAISLSRRLILFALLILTVVAGFITYFLSTKAEIEEFEREFSDLVEEVNTAVNNNAQNVINAFSHFSLSITSFALETNASWPCVTVPDFERRIKSVSQLSKTKIMTFLPVVRDLEQRSRWEAYSVTTGAEWLAESQLAAGIPVAPVPILPFIFDIGVDDLQNTTIFPAAPESAPWMPFWQTGPRPSGQGINWNIGSYVWNAGSLAFMDRTKQPVLSKIFDFNSLVDDEFKTEDATSVFSEPVMSSFADDATVAAMIQTILPWNVFFENVLGEKTPNVVAVVLNTCGQNFTYHIQGTEAKFQGFGTFYDGRYEDMNEEVVIEAFTVPSSDTDLCSYFVKLYPTKALEDFYTTNTPYLMSVVVTLIFGFMAVAFTVFNKLVERRQSKILESAEKTDAIVSSLFPTEFRDRMFDSPKEHEVENKRKEGVEKLALGQLDDHELRLHLDDKPVADLFPETTVLFADIKGFTSWSSVREPTQVFQLLESIYGTFDAIAKRRGIFKVETIGDCYVAVTGLPQPRKDHAIAMARFAHECSSKVANLMQKLEPVLGEGTRDLGMRFGLHSGPTTAGILRGDKARFQLFGDTVNTASRIETTGAKDRIHVSEQCANEIVKAGKPHWLEKRQDKVQAKGKGELQTYWLKIQRLARDSSHEQSESGYSINKAIMGLAQARTSTPIREADGAKLDHLLSMQVEILVPILEELAAPMNQSSGWKNSNMAIESKNNGKVLMEVSHTVDMPKIDRETDDPNDRAPLSPHIRGQLEQLVRAIARTYGDLPFHNFEHATHVTMVMKKLLDSTITETARIDPMTRFSLLFAALIHDVDHRGVSNIQLMKEEPSLATFYDNRCIAEQNAVDVAWSILMDSAFVQLRQHIFPSEQALQHFRQVLVNVIMATDLFDGPLSSLRQERWVKAFANEDKVEIEPGHQSVLSMEHLMQVSDLYHTMDHWHSYQKWNEKLFQEMTQAYLAGRFPKNPVNFWYQGELNFFDETVIPLALKFSQCAHVLGGIPDSVGNGMVRRAKVNRSLWASRGGEIVAEWASRHCPSLGNAHEQDIGAV